MGGLRRLLFLAVVGGGGVVALLALGFWQLDRLAWKNARIAEIELRLAAAPALVQGSEAPADDNFQPATASGRFAGQRQARFLTSQRPHGPGFRLISAFELESGETILVDRGFAPEAEAPRGGDAPTPPAGDVQLVGALHWPNEASAFTPDPNMDDGIWYARDVESLAEWLDAAPVMLVLAEQPTGAATTPWPQPDPVSVDLPNDHLGYAVTWFALAAIWATMTAMVAARRT